MKLNNMVLLWFLMMPCLLVAQGKVGKNKAKPEEGQSGNKNDVPRKSKKGSSGSTPKEPVKPPENPPTEKPVAEDEKPNRISLKIGVGANYYYNNINGIKPLNSKISTAGFAVAPEVMPIGTGSLIYRFNIKKNETKPKRRDRSDGIGIFANYGFLGKKTMENVYQTHIDSIMPASVGQLHNFQPFYEIEGGGLVREAVRISGGSGTQFLQGDKGTKVFNYYTGTLGVIARFGLAEIDATGTVLFGGFYKSPSVRLNITLNLHMRAMK